MCSKIFVCNAQAICLFLFLLLGEHSESFAQVNSIKDSLNLELSKTRTTVDSITILNYLIWNSGGLDTNHVYEYSMKALQLAGRIRDKEKLAEAYDAAAYSYIIKGNLIKAREYYYKCYVIGSENNFSKRIAWGSYNLAKISLSENKLDEALNYAKKSREAFKKLGDIGWILSSDWLLIKSRRNHKNVYVDSAICDYKHAADLTANPNVILDYYLNLIYLYGQKENRSQSMFYAMKALDIAEEIKNEKAILSTYYQIGDYLRDYQHNYDVALLYYQKMLDISKKNKLEQETSSVLNDIGITYKLMGKNSTALTLFNESLEVAKKINHRHSIANAYKNIGEISYLEKNYKDALKYYIKCYNTGCDVCPGIAFHQVLIDIGKVHLTGKDFQNALKYFNKSLALADSSNAGYEKAVSFSALGDYNLQVHNNSLAIKYYLDALKTATTVNSLPLRKEITSKLSEAYKLQNKFAAAFEYLNLSNILADSLNKLSEAENLSRLETKFEFQNVKMQKDLELKESQIHANAEIDKQTQLKYFFIIGFAVMTGLGFVIYRGYSRKKKDNLILEHQKKQLEEMSQKIHEADQKRLKFFTNISHELRTPLTLILGPTEKLIKESTGNGSAAPMLDIIHRNTLQLHNLINQLLDIRKLDTGNVKLKAAPNNIVHYCKGIYSIFAHLSSEQNISYYFNSTQENISAWFDPDIIGKTLNNLLSNAFKYTLSGGKIILSVSGYAENGNDISNVIISVSDNGKGIPEDQMQYVFDRYYQVENSNTGFNNGTGIGLAYTKELIELHHGEINVESKIGEGTTFVIKLPVCEYDYNETEKSDVVIDVNEIPIDEVGNKFLTEMISNEDEDLVEPQEDGSLDEREVMLIVEDNTDLRTFIKSIFEKDYAIHEAGDGITGYKKAADIIPDVIISDIMMPGMNGLELCAKLKNNLHTNHIPVLILTAKAGEENEIEGLKKGADDYLTKPFNSEILEMRIKRLITSRDRLREFFAKEFLLNPKEIKLPSREDEFLKNAVKVVEDNITNPDLNVEMLMNELGVSRTQLFRKLKAITNYSANQFIRNIKLKRAAQLLQQKSLNIAEVVYMSGFNSPSYFASCFKEVYGCLPKEYQSKTEDSNLVAN